jgi:hypothetical protein
VFMWERNGRRRVMVLGLACHPRRHLVVADTFNARWVAMPSATTWEMLITARKLQSDRPP